MTEHVVIVGASRAGEMVDQTEIRQMIGRCGRRSDGIVDIIVESEYRHALEYSLKAGFTVRSSFMDSVSDIAFHLLPEMVSGRIRDEDDASKWFSRSLSHSVSSDAGMLSMAIEFLREHKAISGMSPTTIGRVSAFYYLYPENVEAMRSNLNCIVENHLTEYDVAPAWLLGNVPRDFKVTVTSKLQPRMDCFLESVPMELTSSLPERVFVWHSIMGGIPAGPCRHQALSCRNNYPRISAALKSLAATEEIVCHEFLEEMDVRVNKNVRHDVVKYLSSGNGTKGDAMRQWYEETGEDMD
jgi:hypothetical protein